MFAYPQPNLTYKMGLTVQTRKATSDIFYAALSLTKHRKLEVNDYMNQLNRWIRGFGQ